MTNLLYPLTMLAVVGILVGGYLLGRNRALVPQADGRRFHSTPDYYGFYVVCWMLIPALLATIGLAGYNLFQPDWYDIRHLPAWLAACWIGLPLLALPLTLWRVTPRLRARIFVEKHIYALLFAASAISIVVTVGILMSVVLEAVRFFTHPSVDVTQYFFGTTWEAGGAFLQGAERAGEQAAEAKFGSVPLFTGTLMITAIAMLVAVPIGLLSACFMAEYASSKVRKVCKPVLEVLSGIPTVVYGFFAAITVAPLVVEFFGWFGVSASFENALTPGVIMGVMIIPFVSSLSDDVITAVPQSLRLAAFSMGSTRAETTCRVVLPAALPGIVSAFLLAVSRAVGETMIVTMAAGLKPNLSANPLEQMSTVTAKIVQMLTGDQAYDNPMTLSAFALGLELLVFTLIMNIVSTIIIRRFRQRYEA